MMPQFFGAQGSGPMMAQIQPAIVVASMEFLRFCDNIRMAQACGQLPGDAPRDVSRDLTKKEQLVYDSALDVLHKYFLREETYMPEFHPHPMPPQEPDDPRNPVPVS